MGACEGGDAFERLVNGIVFDVHVCGVMAGAEFAPE